ncbi:MAG: hypothetical protein Q9187_004047, partial [Circinaria calcarea]
MFSSNARSSEPRGEHEGKLSLSDEDSQLPAVENEAVSKDGKLLAPRLESVPNRIAMEAAPSQIGPFDVSQRHQTTVEGALKIQSGTVNPLTGRAYSERYHQLRERVGTLPIRQPEQ